MASGRLSQPRGLAQLKPEACPHPSVNSTPVDRRDRSMPFRIHREVKEMHSRKETRR